jgi:hypothetical protein
MLPYGNLKLRDNDKSHPYRGFYIYGTTTLSRRLKINTLEDKMMANEWRRYGHASRLNYKRIPKCDFNRKLKGKYRDQDGNNRLGEISRRRE